MPNTYSSHPVTARPAFSLIELLVTISIIVLLVGISFPVALKMLGGADISKAKAQLNALGAASAEFRTETGGLPDHTDTTIAGLIVSDDNTDNTIGLFLRQAMQLVDANKMVQSAAGKNALIVTPAGGKDTQAAVGSGINDWVMVDPWENRIRYVSKVSHADAFGDDDYLPPHPTAFFASAGPDGLWGTHAADGTPDEDALDNLYSFDID